MQNNDPLYDNEPGGTRTAGSVNRYTTLEIGLMITLMFVLAGGKPPAVNEAHYWTKAKHFWNPAWCERDLFLSSGNAHLVYFVCCGWITNWTTLEISAWLGRVCGWSVVAIGWWYLSTAVVPLRFYSLLSFAMVTMLWHFTHMAGEWVVGGLEAKVLAYGFVFLALGSALRQRAAATLILLSLAVAFHPIVGLWSLMLTGFAWSNTINQRSIAQHALVLLVCAAVIGAVVWITLRGDLTDAATHAAANRIYVFERLPHHLLLHRFPPLRILRFSGLVLCWLIIWHTTRDHHTLAVKRIQRFALGSLTLVGLGICWEALTLVAPTLGTALLKIYWYRLADIAVPMAMTFLIVAQLARAQHDSQEASQQSFANRLAVTLAATSVAVAWAFFEQRMDPRPGADQQADRLASTTPDNRWRRFEDWRAICDWANRHTPSEGLFLTPLPSQTFRWYAERAQLVNWKDIPQDADSMVSWWRAIQAVKQTNLYDPWLPVSVQLLDDLLEEYRIDYIVTTAPRPLGSKQFPLVYRNSSYMLFQVTRSDIQRED